MEKIRAKAFSHVTDQKVIEEVAQNEENKALRLRAIKQVHSEDVLRKIGRTDSNLEIKLFIVEHTHLEEDLHYMVMNDDNEKVRLMAVDKIADLKLLEDIKANCTDKEIASLANQKINRKVLAEAEAASSQNNE